MQPLTTLDDSMGRPRTKPYPAGPKTATIIARNFRLWRESRGEPQSEIARQLGVAQKKISLIELGNGNPTLHTLEFIATAMGIPLASLVSEPAENTPAEKDV